MGNLFRSGASIATEIGKSVDARKFGYDVSMRAPARTDFGSKNGE